MGNKSQLIPGLETNELSFVQILSATWFDIEIKPFVFAVKAGMI